MKFKAVFSFTCLTAALCSSVYASNLTNFNEKNIGNLTKAISQKNIHIVHFGDSHTAADEMTDALRVSLQQSLGNGGMGWGMPMYFAGQRMARFGYDNVGWTPISSRAQHVGNYTIGGMNAIPQYSGATLTIKAKQSYEATQKILVSIRQAPDDGKFTGIDADGRHFTLEAPIKNNTWQTVEFIAKLPFTITAQQTSHSALGGWWARNLNGSGAIISPIGINGAELTHWNRWNQGWGSELAKASPQLVILAYGTNEAYNDRVDIEQTRDTLIHTIQKIRQATPQTAIMILSAPESLKNTTGECGSRPMKLTAMQNMQKQVAQYTQTLFWDWQQAMGGSCSMKTWIRQGKGLKDGVHFSKVGYQTLGQQLAQDILNITNGSSNVEVVPTTVHYSSQVPQNLGYAKICLEGASECLSIGRE